MPAHIYIQVGRYHDAVVANQRAIAADQDYITQCHAQGIYPLEGKTREAFSVQERFEQAWKYADVKLIASRF